MYLNIKAGSIICTKDFSFCVFSCIFQAFYNKYVITFIYFKNILKATCVIPPCLPTSNSFCLIVGRWIGWGKQNLKPILLFP